jgi:hypothetical protein
MPTGTTTCISGSSTMWSFSVRVQLRVETARRRKIFYGVKGRKGS